ncbi:MAG: alpha-E domain-containing protein [Paludisphaera borealis]|uniref:alpha-E domain-containing protein n=1 Tax=Paludisphaera borealis TaxID=1387353 RepID=UPI002847BFD0|nr:alpha-E domain-containing protein [Paludisphaera borealis]MDR3620836.1 alpha-E domain-containing protein [Paludisphaera borealis]
MLSRVAESLYWMSRYIERAENVARLLDIGLDLELDAAEIGVDEGFAPVEIALTILACREAFPAEKNRRSRDAVLRFLTFDRSNPQSILSMIARARENARGTQESIGVDVWSEVNRLYLFLGGSRAQRRFARGPSALFASISHSCLLLDGLVQNTLPRDEVYHFLQLGRHLERLDVLCRILLAKCPSLTGEALGPEVSFQLVRWTSLLRSCSAYGAYLRSERERIEPEGVIRFLVLNSDFPRSIRYAAARCQDSLEAISGGDDDAYGCEAERILGRLESDLRYIDVPEIFDRGLLKFLGSLQGTCYKVSDQIQQSFFLM